jgi:hypothetical protein
MRHLFTCTFLLAFTSVFAQFSQEHNLTSRYGSVVNTLAFDVDGDSDLDLITGSVSYGKIAWYENDGQGNFGIQKIIAVYPQYVGLNFLTSGDLDGDGDIDLVAAEGPYREIVWYENQGNGTFSNTQPISSPPLGAQCLRTADIDGDGDVDILSSSEAAEEIVWYENLGGVTFGPPQQINDLSYEFSSFQPIDFDSDGDIDVVSKAYSNGSIAWFENLGGGVFANEQAVGYASGVTVMDIADLNGDGDLDVVATSNGASNVTWFESLGNGSFAPAVIITNIAFASDVIAADLDGDGDMDILPRDSSVEWYENNGTGAFPTSHVINTSTQFVGFIFLAADLDGDGDNDIIGSTTEVIQLENLGAGSFGSGVQITFSALEATAVSTGDIDGDGKTDILSAARYSDKISWHRNLGGHVFAPEVAIHIGWSGLNGPTSVHAADMDNDGDLDVLVSAQYDHRIAWHNNPGNGDFTTYYTITTQAMGATCVHPADLDNDGDMDVISSSADDDKIAWYENLGGGSFGPDQTISLNADSAWSVFAADLDNDGDLDILSASKQDNKIAFYENLGGGAFSAEQIISTQAIEALSVYAADIDGDGDIDVLSASYGDNKIAWYENLGSLSFGSENIISTLAQGASSVYTEDIDGDGDLDVLSASVLDNKIAWYENAGNGTFGAQQIIIDDAMGAYSVHCADLDGDGDPEVISASRLDDRLLWFDNQNISLRQARGKIFYDLNQNAILDSSDVGLTHIPVISNPLSEFAYTYNSGNYIMNFDASAQTYVIQPGAMPHWNLVTDSASYVIDVDTSYASLDDLDFGFYPDTIIDDLTPTLVGGFPRCNDTINYWFQFENIGTTTPSGIVVLHLDSAVTFAQSFIAPDSIVGQDHYWHFDSIPFFGIEAQTIQVLMPTFLSMGETLSSSLSIIVYDSVGGVQFTSTAWLHQVLVCAYDPNDKIVSPAGADNSGYILSNTEQLEYTIRFQNTGNDTAINIQILDQLDPNLDWQTLMPIASSHPMQVTGTSSGLMTFAFQNIMLPDSNVNALGSQGFLKYKINVIDGLPLGTTIENHAEIYFDANPAVITNSTLNTLYDCSSMQVTIPSISMCEGDVLTAAVQDEISSTTFAWDFAGVTTQAGANFTWTTDSIGVFDLVMTMSNSLCTLDTTVQVTVNFQGVQFLGTTTGCIGDSVLIFGQYQSTSGLYSDTFVTANGCDSILETQLDLAQLPVVTVDAFSLDTICVEDGPVNLPAGTPTGGAYSGNGVSSTQFDPLLAGDGTHYLHYSYTNGDNCISSDSTQIVVQICTGLLEIDRDAISVYPNPFSNFTTLHFGQSLYDVYTIRIIDVLGKVVYEKFNVTENKHRIEQQGWGSGIFVLILISEATGKVEFTTNLVVE